MLKRRVEVVFKSDGLPEQIKAMDKVITLIEGLAVITNNETSKLGFRMSMKVKVKD